MLALARFTLKGPYQATLVVGLLATVAVFIIPLLGYSAVSMIVAFVTNLLAVVLVGLIILTQGTTAGIKVIAVAALALSLVAWMGLKSAEPGISMALMQWLPVIVLAQVLRSSKSLALTLLAGVLIGMVVIVAQIFVWAELESSWLANVVQLVQHREDAAEISEAEAQQLVQLARRMMLMLASTLYLIYAVIILIARWLQAKLADSQGFGEEFRALALGKPAALVAAAGISLSLWIPEAWLVSFAYLAIVAFMFQGIAVVHSRLAAKKQSSGLFVLFYVLLVLAWEIAGVLTAITGILDNWLDFRKKPEDRSDVN